MSRRTRGVIGLWLAAVGIGGGASAGLFSAANCPVEPASGRIAYRQVQGEMVREKTMVWSDHGRRYREDTGGLLLGSHRLACKDTWTICDGAAVYISESMAGKYYRRLPLGDASDLISPFAYARLPSSVIGTQQVLGKPCEVRRAGRFKVWVWKGVVLKIDWSRPGGEADQLLAVRLQTPARISPGLFRVPAGFRLLPR